jgi:hypothetical protein
MGLAEAVSFNRLKNNRFLAAPAGRAVPYSPDAPAGS